VATTPDERRVEETPARKVTFRRRAVFSFPFPNLRTGTHRRNYVSTATQCTSTMSKMLDTNYRTLFSVLRSPEEGEEFKRII